MKITIEISVPALVLLAIDILMALSAIRGGGDRSGNGAAPVK